MIILYLWILAYILIFLSIFGLYYIFYKNINKKSISKFKNSNLKEQENNNLEEQENNNLKEQENYNIEEQENYNNLEDFKLDISNIDTNNYDSKLCKFKDDTGLVCPIHYKNKVNDEIKPFQECPTQIKDMVCNHIFTEWSKETKVNNVNEAYTYITSNWTGGDIFYVLYNNHRLIGLVAVDRKLFYPYISHLYVIKEERKKGYGKMLIDFSIEYINKLQFNEARLWCEIKLVPYYTKLGWIVLESQKDKIIMIYTIKEIF